MFILSYFDKYIQDVAIFFISRYFNYLQTLFSLTLAEKVNYLWYYFLFCWGLENLSTY